MAKRGLFITRNDFPCVVYDILKERFDITCWKGVEDVPKNKLIENIKGKFGILCTLSNVIDKEVIEAAGNDFKVVSTCSVGYDHLDVKELKSRGIRIGYTPGVLTEATAEQALAILLATSRRVVESHNLVASGNWTAKGWGPTWMCGHGLDASTVGILGCGRIGFSIMRKLKAFDPSRIFYFSRSEKPEAKQLGAELKPLDEIMKESDFVVIALSQTPETRGIINKERIALMKPNAILVNIARGGLIDQEALIEALKNKKISGAGLDVYATEPLPADSPLLKMDNVVTTPHIGSATHKSRSEMGVLSAKNILAVLDNEKMPAEL
ncbi:glyoxylate reductase/hydroxypyruvate reductase-like [Planococcus citri]|uniref:glyoxylate reductase/hydroxypyruvate reductase-like n=1 Tax=Planococcus citri TaxID=170843 RepID=UPI0031F810A5